MKRRRRKATQPDESERQDAPPTLPTTMIPPKPNNYKFFLALALTRASNTALRIGVWALWNGFASVLTYNSHTSMKKLRIPSSFFPSCNNKNFMFPGVTKADTVQSLNLSTAFRYIAPSFRITSSIASKLAFAIICITWRSCPPPTLVCPLVDCCVVLDAPESAVNVPAKADVDHVGKLAARGEVTVCVGFEDWCVSVYSGVSDGERRNKWCDIVPQRRG